MIVNRRYILIILPLVLLFLGLGLTFFLINHQIGKSGIESREVVLKNAIAVPVDAIAIFCFKDITQTEKAFMDSSSIFSNFIDKDNALYNLIESIEKIYENTTPNKETSFWENLVSLHYSAKNDISLLFCLDLSNVTIDKEQYKQNIFKLYPGKRERIFNKNEIFILDGVQFSVYKNIFIASTSQIVLESSLRHLASGSSVMDNRDFLKVLKESVWEDNILFINNQQIGKIFSGVSARKFWGYSDFFSKIGSWTTLKGEFSSTYQRYRGTFANFKGVGNYSTGFSNQTGARFEAWEILPHNTFGVLTIPLKDFNRFFGLYQEYKELYKKLNSKNTNTYKEWFLSLNPMEVSTALIPYGGKLNWVTLLKTKMKSSDNKVGKFNNKGAVSYLFGEVFSHTREDFYCKIKDWIIIGSEDIVKEFSNGSFPGFTMKDYFRGSDAYNQIMVEEETLLSLIVNVSLQQDSIAGFFKPVIKENVSGGLEKKNFETIVYQLYSTESGAEMSLLLYAEQMKILPTPKKPGEDNPRGWESDTLIQVPTGPFELINYTNGEKEYLEQLPNYKLRLLNKDKKGIWTIPFSSPLRGFAEQVDYYKNKNRQMLFASGNELYLLDRLGRFTKPFPKRVESLIMLGPKTYNLKRDGDYVIMLLHADNFLRLYDRACNPYPAWNDIRTNEKIKMFPELIFVGKNSYWVLRTQLQTIIFTVNGNPVTKFANRNVLLPTTDLNIISENEVEVTTKEGKNVILNLENGQIKRLKK